MRHRFAAAQISSSPGGTSGKERRSELLSSRRGREAHLSTWRRGHRTSVADLAGQPASISAGQLPGRRHRQRRAARSSSPGEGHARRGLSAGECMRRADPQGGGVTRPLRVRVGGSPTGADQRRAAVKGGGVSRSCCLGIHAPAAPAAAPLDPVEDGCRAWPVGTPDRDRQSPRSGLELDAVGSFCVSFLGPPVGAAPSVALNIRHPAD
jgi:hypothetical protein